MIQAVARCLTLNVNVILRNGLQCLLGSVLLIGLSKMLSIIVFILGFIHWSMTQRYGNYSRRATRAQQDALAEANKGLTEL